MLALPAGVAQLVAQAICNRQVVGSSPTAGSTDKCAGRAAVNLCQSRRTPPPTVEPARVANRFHAQPRFSQANADTIRRTESS
jgi:hypothetical protein